MPLRARLGLPIIDAHTHVVAADRRAYPLHSEDRTQAATRWLDHAVTAEELLSTAKSAGVSRVALVQSLSAHGYDNSYVSDSARAFPGPAIGIGTVNPHAVDPVGELRHAVQQRGVRGIRLFDHSPFTDSPLALDLPVMRPIAQATVELGVPLLVMTSYDRLPLLHELLDASPGLRLVIDHCGLPDLAAAQWWHKSAELLRLAERAGVFLKVTPFTLSRLPAGGASRFAAELTERVPASRLMWGSDFPHMFDRPYAALVNEARLMTSVMPESDAAQFLAGTAATIWPSSAPNEKRPD